MEWDNGATIGFNAAGDPYANHDPSTADVACLNMMYTNWSNVEYLLSDENPETPAPRTYIIACIFKINHGVLVFSYRGCYSYKHYDS